MKTKWVLSCGARRSGSTLQYHLAREVVVRNGGHNLGWRIWQYFDSGVELVRDKEYPYVLVKCHAHIPSLSKECFKLWRSGQAYGVFVHRNMYDTMASMLRLNKANIGIVPEQLIYEDVVATIKEITLWLNTDNVLVSAYDDIMSHDGKIAEVQRIATHIGASVSTGQAQEIASEYSIEKQRERLPETGFDSEYGLWADHIGTGETGGWKDKLTEEQVDFCRTASSELHERLGYDIDGAFVGTSGNA